MKAQNLLLSFLCLAVIASLTLQALSLTAPRSGGGASGGEEVEALREYASQLKANQLYAKAAEAYDAYVARSDRPSHEKANIDFNTGKMLLDQVGDAEGALAHFLRVTHLYPDAAPDIQKEARQLSAECLERLGRTGAAERQLVEATRLVPGEEPPVTSVEEADILATIGSRVTLSREDFEEMWKQIPQEVRQRDFPEPEGRRRFLEEMTASRLYAEAARRKGYDRDPQLRRRLQTLEDSFLANRLMQEEIAGKVTLSESDVQIFYEANKAHYATPPTVEAAHILVPDASAALAARARIESGSAFEEIAQTLSTDPASRDKGGRLGPIRQQPPALVGDPPVDPLDVSIPGIGRDRVLAEALFALQHEGEIVGPVESSRGFHLLKLIRRSEAEAADFQKARPLAERDLRARREREKQSELLAELMKAHSVRIHPERLR